MDDRRIEGVGEKGREVNFLRNNGALPTIH